MKNVIFESEVPVVKDNPREGSRIIHIIKTYFCVIPLVFETILFLNVHVFPRACSSVTKRCGVRVHDFDHKHIVNETVKEFKKK